MGNCGMEDELLYEIVGALEDAGVEPMSFVLHDTVSPDALERVVADLEGDFRIAFEIEGIPLEITPEGVRAGDRIHTTRDGDVAALEPVVAADEPDEAMDAAVSVLEDAIGAEVTKVAVARNGRLVPAATTAGGQTGPDHAVPIENSIPGTVYESGSGCVISDLHDVRGSVASTPATAAGPTHPGPDRSFVCAPVREFGVVYGVHQEPAVFVDRDLAATRTVGRVLGLVVGKSEGITVP